jgi:hypothetical protein
MTRYRIALVLTTATAAIAAAGCGGDDAEQAADEAATQAESVVSQAETAIAGATDEVATATGAAGEALQDGLTVNLEEQNGSGQSGTATFSVNDDGTVHVSIMISPAGTEPQPAHIHEGTCDNLDPNPAFPLENVVDGTSETDVDVSLDDLAVTSYAVNVHKSEAEADVYVACGDLTNVTG